MKKLTILIMLFSAIAYSQEFKIRSSKESKSVEFVHIQNDTINIEVLYKNKVVEAKRIVSRIKCIHDYKEQKVGTIYAKVVHYLIDGKKINSDDILYERRLNNNLFTIEDTFINGNSIPLYGMPTYGDIDANGDIIYNWK